MVTRLTVQCLAVGLGLAGATVVSVAMVAFSGSPDPAGTPPAPASTCDLEGAPASEVAVVHLSGPECAPQLSREEDPGTSGLESAESEDEDSEQVPENSVEIRGCVVNSAGLPIPGARVEIKHGGGEDTGPDGAFAAGLRLPADDDLQEGVGEDTELLTVIAEGYRTCTLTRSVLGQTLPQPGGSADLGKITLWKGVDVEIRVVDGEGNPMVGAPIDYGGEEVQERDDNWIHTGSEGRCWQLDMDPVHAWWFRARAFGVRSEILDLRGVVHEGESQVATLVLPGVVTGVLRLRFSRYVEDPEVLVDGESVVVCGTDDETDDDADERLVSVLAGPRAVVVTDEGGSPLFAGVIEAVAGRESIVDVLVPEPRRKEPLRPEPGGAWVSGVVVDERGVTVEGACLQGPPHGGSRRGPAWGGYSEREGTFNVHVFPERASGGYLFWVLAGSGVSRCVEGTPAQWDLLRAGQSVTGLRIEIPRSATVSGVVRDAEGRTVRDARVCLFEDPFLPSCGPCEEVTTDAIGRFRFRGVDPEASLWLAAGKGSSASVKVPLGGSLLPGTVTARDLVVQPVRRIPIEVRTLGLRSGWRVEILGKVSVAEGPSLTVEVPTGHVAIEIQTREGHKLEEVREEIPEDASSHLVTRDFTDDPWKRRVASGGHD